jgi:triosephosphate isomerase
MSLLVVANFKSNLTQVEVQAWIKAVKPTPNMIVAPSFPHLPLFTDLRIHGSTDLQLCAQDVSPFPRGSYTGEVNAAQLKELGASYCIVGHSERRRYFHETHNEIAGKIKELIEVGITPILCLDETDIALQFAALDAQFYDKCLYCFEPGGGLGGTTTAQPSKIEDVKNQIRRFVPNARFMYGGSVTPDNVASLLPLKLDGLLVATASLTPASFISIVQTTSHVS